MFSRTIKRSIATLGVVAGLLAAAVPANAAGVIGGSSKAPGTQVGSEGVKVPATTHDQSKAVVVLIGANDYGFTATVEPQGTNASLGRENSIECLAITVCHEGFEIR